MVGNTNRFLGKFLNVKGKVAQVEFLAKLKIIHLMKHVALNGLGELAYFFLKEIDAVNLFGDETGCLKIVA